MTFFTFTQRRRRESAALFLVFTKLPSSLAPQIYSAGAGWRRVTWPYGKADREKREQTLLLGHEPGWPLYRPQQSLWHCGQSLLLTNDDISVLPSGNSATEKVSHNAALASLFEGEPLYQMLLTFAESQLGSMARNGAWIMKHSDHISTKDCWWYKKHICVIGIA